MAVTVTLLGVNYSIPEPGDVNYDQALTIFFKALPTAFPQLNGGAYALTGELDFGASFGVKALYLKTETTLPSTTGVVRLAKSDALSFRNNANSADLPLKIDTQDGLLFNGANVTGNPMCSANTPAGQSIPTGGTETIVVFGGVELDTDTAYNASTGRYTVPTGKSGHYEMVAQVSYGVAPTGTCTASIYRNGLQIKTTQFIAPGGGQSIPVMATYLFAAGDIIDIRTKQGSGSAQSLTTNAAQNYFVLKRIPT